MRGEGVKPSARPLQSMETPVPQQQPNPSILVYCLDEDIQFLLSADSGCLQEVHDGTDSQDSGWS